MIAQDEFIDRIILHVMKAQQGKAFCDDIFSDTIMQPGNNEFLFFIKPEITMPSDRVKLDAVLKLIYQKLDAYGLVVRHIKILSAAYLKQYNIIAQHYGVINQLASNASKHLSLSAREKFLAVYGQRVEDVKVLGGLEFLDQYPALDAWALNELWQDGEFIKLAGGTYCMKLSHENETIYLVNGFHPKQLLHFTQENRSIVVMTLSGDTPWRVARNDFIGATMPDNAKSGSLRREFLDRQNELGLPDISPSANGVHLSAGPVEGLVELRRYNSDLSNPDQILGLSDFSFGRALLDAFSPADVERITSNTNLLVDGREVSVFDLTEEMDSDEAIKTLVHHFT